MSLPRFSSLHFERLYFMRSPFASFNIPSCAGSLAQAYCSVKSSFMSYHSFCPRYDTRVKAYLNLSASKSDTA